MIVIPTALVADLLIHFGFITLWFIMLVTKLSRLVSVGLNK